MAFSDAVVVPAPTRFSLAGGFAIAVVLASMMHAPADPFAQLGPFGLLSIDKWIHVGSYAGISFLIAYAYLARSRRTLVVIATMTILLGIGVEFIQSTISWRTMEAADIVANSIGSVGALVLWGIAWRCLPIQFGRDSDRKSDSRRTH